MILERVARDAVVATAGVAELGIPPIGILRGVGPQTQGDLVAFEGVAGDGDVLAVLCLLYTSDAAAERSQVDLGGCGIIKKKKKL